MIVCSKCESNINLKLRWSILNKICPFCGNKINIEQEYVDISNKVFNKLINIKTKKDLINEVYDIIEGILESYNKKLNNIKKEIDKNNFNSDVKVNNQTTSDNKQNVDEDIEINNDNFTIIEDVDDTNNKINFPYNYEDDDSDDIDDIDNYIEMYIPNNELKNAPVVEKRIPIATDNKFKIKPYSQKD